MVNTTEEADARDQACCLGLVGRKGSLGSLQEEVCLHWVFKDK